MCLGPLEVSKGAGSRAQRLLPAGVSSQKRLSACMQAKRERHPGNAHLYVCLDGCVLAYWCCHEGGADNDICCCETLPDQELLASESRCQRGDRVAGKRARLPCVPLQPVGHGCCTRSRHSCCSTCKCCNHCAPSTRALHCTQRTLHTAPTCAATHLIPWWPCQHPGWRCCPAAPRLAAQRKVTALALPLVMHPPIALILQ